MEELATPSASPGTVFFSAAAPAPRHWPFLGLSVQQTVLFSLPVKALFAMRLSSCDSATPSLGSLGQSESLPPSWSSHLDFLISASPTAPDTVLGREMNRRGFVIKCLHLHVRLLSCWVEGADLPCGLSLFSDHMRVFSSDPYICHQMRGLQSPRHAAGGGCSERVPRPLFHLGLPSRAHDHWPGEHCELTSRTNH